MILTICPTLKGWQSISVDFLESIPRWAALGKRRENAASFSEKPGKSEPDKANPQISDYIEITSVHRDLMRFTVFHEVKCLVKSGTSALLQSLVSG